MSPAAWLVLLSLAGAAAFFLAGALATRPRAAAPAVARELAALRSAHAVALDDRHRLGDEVIRLTAAVRAAAELAADNARLRAAAADGAAALAATMSRGGLEGLVRHLAADPRVAAAVVSDELGLLVAGAGDGAEEMAAAGGYLAGVGDRTGALTHLGAASRIVVEDDRGATVTATRLPGAPLVAITMTRPRDAA